MAARPIAVATGPLIILLYPVHGTELLVLPPAEGAARFSQIGYEFWPEALEAVIRYASVKARVPLFVTESGVATDDDSQRIEFVERALAGVARCLDDGVDVRGYFYRSMLDNFEWLFGHAPKFGLIAADRETRRRTIQPSAR
jgi:beta-glucosidase